MDKSVIIIGAGGHGKVIADIILKSGDDLLGFLDDNKVGNVISSYKVLDKIEAIYKYIDKAKFVIGIGDNCLRKKIAEKYKVDWYTAIHPSAKMGLDATIGVGTVIMPNAVINSEAQIGEHCIVNTGAIVEHESRVCNYVHISPRGTICGNVYLGECVQISAGAIVKNNITICGDVIIGTGGVVIRNIDKKGIYVGIPVKLLEERMEPKH